MAKPRVLIVENDQNWRQAHAEYVEELGYEAIFAEGQGDSLIEDALNKNRDYRCHTAIVDMRLRSDKESEDLSGIDEVALKLDPASVIVVSGYVDLDIANRISVRARARETSLEFANKKSFETLLDMLNRSVWQASAEARGLVVFDERSLLSQFDANAADEIRDVLGRLFPESIYSVARLVLKPFGDVAAKSQNNSHLNSVKLLLWVTPQGEKTELVKIASKEKIRAEIACSQILFDRRFLSRNLTRINSSWLAWKLGGIVYDVEQQRSLVEIYQSDEADDEVILLRGLEWFFKSTLPKFRKLPVYDDLDQTLVNLYLGVNQPFPSRPEFNDPQVDQIQLMLPDPSIWIKENLSDVTDDKFDRSHGEMRLERILVDIDKSMTFLTGDDLRSPMGLLKSSVALELDLLMNAIPSNEVDKGRLLVNLIISIAEPNQIIRSDQDILPTKDAQYNHFTRKAIWAISHLRRLVHSIMPSNVTQEDYLIRLMLECGNRLLRKDENLNSDQVSQLHLIASLITARIRLYSARGLAWLEQPLPFPIELLNQSDMSKWTDEVQQLQQEIEFLRREGKDDSHPRIQKIRGALTQFGM